MPSSDKIKILIIKLGAKGDVIRTLPILLALKEKNPNSEIWWITKPQSKEILETVKNIDKILTVPCQPKEKFDILYNFDIDEEATSLALKTKADKKYGFYKKQNSDYVEAFNLPAEYHLNTLFDDGVKKSNKKTYQEMMFQAAELDWKGQHHPIYLSEQDKKYAEEFIKKNNLKTEKLIGLHIGSSPRWPSKAWHESKIVEFIKKTAGKNYEVLLFAGLDDIKKQKEIIDKLRKEGIRICSNNPYNSDNQFVSLVSLCKTIICSDSLALHVSLALKKPTICLFFCTSPYEIEGDNLLKKIVSPMLYDFFPEKMDQYNEELVKSISPEEVLKVLESI